MIFYNIRFKKAKEIATAINYEVKKQSAFSRRFRAPCSIPGIARSHPELGGTVKSNPRGR